MAEFHPTMTNQFQIQGDDDLDFDHPRPGTTRSMEGMDGQLDPVLGTMGPANAHMSFVGTMGNQYMMNPPMWDPKLSQAPAFVDAQLSATFVQASAKLPAVDPRIYTTSSSGSNRPLTMSSRKSSSSSVPSSTSRQQMPPSPARGQKQPHDFMIEDEEELEDDELDDFEGNPTKREKFLARNRVAASKCRKKKKQRVNELEEHQSGLEQEHNTLQMEYKGLVDEISRMKTEIMAHATCNDSNIDTWLEAEARRFVTRTAKKYRVQACAAGECQNSHHQGDAGSST